MISKTQFDLLCFGDKISYIVKNKIQSKPVLRNDYLNVINRFISQLNDVIPTAKCHLDVVPVSSFSNHLTYRVYLAHKELLFIVKPALFDTCYIDLAAGTRGVVPTLCQSSYTLQYQLDEFIQSDRFLLLLEPYIDQTTAD